MKALGLILIAAPESVIYAWNSIPLDMKDAIPNDWISTAGILLVIASSFAQIIRQRGPYNEANSKRTSEFE